jgi:hypothetical protein
VSPVPAAGAATPATAEPLQDWQTVPAGIWAPQTLQKAIIPHLLICKSRCGGTFVKAPQTISKSSVKDKQNRELEKYFYFAAKFNDTWHLLFTSQLSAAAQITQVF